jgi:aminocarboxymuconate-semialdehyde decarboxylase
MQKYYLVNLIGYPMETSLAIASIIFGGVLEEFPKLKFCFVHAGGGIPYQIGRLRHGYQERSEARTSISRPPSKYMNLMYFDSITHYPPALKYLIATVGSDKVLMGSDFPYDMGDPHPVSSIRKLMLSSENEKRILGKNAANLLKICVGAHQLTN